MWELDCEESWVLKNWCLWTVVLEKTLESPLDCKEIQPVHSKWDQSWVFIVRDPDAGRDWGQEEKGTTEDEMAGWHHWFNGRESEWTPGVGDGQGGLACYNSWGRRVGHDWTTELNWTDKESWATLVAQMVKKSACNVGGPGSVSGSGRSSGGGRGNSLQYSCLDNCMDREAWCAIVYGITE